MSGLYSDSPFRLSTQQDFFIVDHSENNNSHLKGNRGSNSVLTIALCLVGLLHQVYVRVYIYICLSCWTFNHKNAIFPECFWFSRSWLFTIHVAYLCRGSVWHVRMVLRVTATYIRRTPCCREKMTHCVSG